MSERARRIIETLLIADGPHHGETLRRAFAGSPRLRVRDVIDTREAYAYLTDQKSSVQSRPDLLVVDVARSEADGCFATADLLRRIKSHADLRGVPLVILGEEDALSEMGRSPQYGLCSVGKKPADPEELRSMAFHLGEYWGAVARVPPKDDLSLSPEQKSPSPIEPQPQFPRVLPMSFRCSVEILVVDDNNDDATLFQESLAETEHIQISQILDEGETVLAYLRRQGRFHNVRLPDLLVLDIHMPQKPGFALLDEIKSDAALRNLPVVMLTASRHEADIWESYSRGACSFVEKPAQFEQFREMAIRFANYWTRVAHLPNRENE